MGSDAILDFAMLQTGSPPATDPVENPSPDSPYWKVYNIRELAVRAEKESAAAADGVPDRTSISEWRNVQDAVCQAIAAGCWHFKLLGWLIEALVRTSGYAGLRDGFRLGREMIETHWAEFYPALSEGAVDRVAPLAGLNGEGREGPLPALVRRIPLIPDSLGGYTLLHYLKALELEGVPDAETRSYLERQVGAITMQQIMQATAQTPREFAQTLAGDLDEAHREFETLWKALETHCSSEMPGFPPDSHIQSVFTHAREALVRLFPYLGNQPGATGGSEAGSTSTSGKNGSGSVGRAIAGRDQAFQQLLEVASFFRQSEPHSPVPYLLELAVRWGRTPLHSLLTEPTTHELLSKLVEAQQPAVEQN